MTGFARAAEPYLSSPVDGSRSKLCMISSSDRKEDGCPGERVKDTLLSEVHLPKVSLSWKNVHFLQGCCMLQKEDNTRSQHREMT